MLDNASKFRVIVNIHIKELYDIDSYKLFVKNFKNNFLIEMYVLSLYFIIKKKTPCLL